MDKMNSAYVIAGEASETDSEDDNVDKEYNLIFLIIPF